MKKKLYLGHEPYLHKHSVGLATAAPMLQVAVSNLQVAATWSYLQNEQWLTKCKKREPKRKTQFFKIHVNTIVDKKKAAYY